MSIGETVTITPGVTYDADDNPIAGGGPSIDISGCVIEPMSSEEHTLRGRHGVYTRVRVYISQPPAAPIPRTADVVIRGLTYIIGGDIAQFVDPEGVGDIGGLVIDAYRMEG